VSSSGGNKKKIFPDNVNKKNEPNRKTPHELKLRSVITCRENTAAK